MLAILYTLVALLLVLLADRGGLLLNVDRLLPQALLAIKADCWSQTEDN